ncbi:hypothetical protein ACIQUG_06620 [Ensifer sp. NPDC090286]|uniref:hypothetical protein n=1 Tax=Ensifer sp. NPDC090286 TaxID=3363991 RepID=UPI00383A0150
MRETWFQRQRRLSDERNTVAQHEYEIEAIKAHHAPKIAKAKTVSAQALHEAEEQEYFEVSIQYDLIDAIRTKQLIREAIRLGVPVPRHSKESDFWYESRQLGSKHLTDDGQHFLRREIASEIELRQKPFLTWGAFLISVLGLCISMIAIAQ